MRYAFLRVVDWLLNSYWVIPAVLVLGAVALSLFTVGLDERGVSLGDIPYIYTRDADGARALLTTIAGSIATIAGVVFSITLVTLTLASNQFGSRILRNFSRDSGNKVVLGLMLGTFVYALMVVRTISPANGNPFVPHLSVLVGILLALISLATLIYFIHHTVTSIQPENVISALAGEAHTLVNELYPQELGRGDAEPPRPAAPPDRGDPVYAPHSGYIGAIDTDRLMRLACKHDVVVRLFVRAGDFVERGSPVAGVIASRGGARPEDVHAIFEIGPRRTYVEDLDFALQQLTLVAVRALSPAVNDPFTAITCVDRLGAVFGHLSTRRIPAPERLDGEGRVRVIAPRRDFGELLDSAFVPILESARGSYTVLSHMVVTLSSLLSRTSHGPYRGALQDLREQVHRTGRTEMEEHLRTHFDRLCASMDDPSFAPKRVIGGIG